MSQYVSKSRVLLHSYASHFEAYGTSPDFLKDDTYVFWLLQLRMTPTAYVIYKYEEKKQKEYVKLQNRKFDNDMKHPDSDRF